MSYYTSGGLKAWSPRRSRRQPLCPLIFPKELDSNPGLDFCILRAESRCTPFLSTSSISAITHCGNPWTLSSLAVGPCFSDFSRYCQPQHVYPPRVLHRVFEDVYYLGL
ncbi:hypothetical protein FRC03_007137 [Tulasnella sp. 419]|nr:hypothetical protein FRC03_007137 [Tulasnella sp. 419]